MAPKLPLQLTQLQGPGQGTITSLNPSICIRVLRFVLPVTQQSSVEVHVQTLKMSAEPLAVHCMEAQPSPHALPPQSGFGVNQPSSAMSPRGLKRSTKAAIQNRTLPGPLTAHFPLPLDGFAS